MWVWVCEGVTGENISYISFSMLKITERFIPVFSTWNTKSLDNYKHTICIYNTHTHTKVKNKNGLSRQYNIQIFNRIIFFKYRTRHIKTTDKNYRNNKKAIFL